MTLSTFYISDSALSNDKEIMLDQNCSHPGAFACIVLVHVDTRVGKIQRREPNDRHMQNDHRRLHLRSSKSTRDLHPSYMSRR